MKIHIIAPALPPALDALGDYTALLSQELAGAAQIKVLIPKGCSPDPIPGVEIEAPFTVQQRSSVRRITRVVETDRPDWVVLQFNQFSYGRWGLNPYLPLTMRAMRRRCPNTRLAVMFHEEYVPAINWKCAMMTTWQRWQLRTLGRSADTIFFSIEPWVRRFSPWFPGKPVLHLPVGSNVPLVPIEREGARSRLGIPDDASVLGIFGNFRNAPMMERIRGAAEAAQKAGYNVLVLYIGPHGSQVRSALGDLPIIAEGPLPAGEVSRRFAAMDVFFSAYIDGVSTRRGALMAGLQHSVATVGTVGFQTDRILHEQHGCALLLADVDSQEQFNHHTLRLLGDRSLRIELGREAQQFYHREFAWQRIGHRLLAALGRSK